MWSGDQAGGEVRDHGQVPSDELPETYGRGVRTPWTSLPAAVQQWVSDQLGGPVIEARDAIGGFAPGTAAVVRTADRSAFCKAAANVPNPTALELYRGERARLAALPQHPSIVKPIAAADLMVDDVTWAVTLFPALPGRVPRHPWTEPQAVRVFDALAELGEVLAASTQAEASRLPGSENLVGFFGHWAAIVADPSDEWASLPWVVTATDRLLEADRLVQAQAAGSVPAHTDLRADNIMLAAESHQVWFVDWAAAQTAATWVDPAILSCDLVASGADRADGGSMDVWRFLRAYPATAAVGDDLLWGMIIALAAALHRLSRRPDPPGLPTIRAWQRLSAEALLRFAARGEPG